mmetsp:Transcript_27486/g.66862  ORF Transcript_27486/g.66862 Transcript_27486/m.66862 type:complete len:202 (+) Transcript_27486:1075-1680(+)
MRMYIDLSSKENSVPKNFTIFGCSKSFSSFTSSIICARISRFWRPNFNFIFLMAMSAPVEWFIPEYTVAKAPLPRRFPSVNSKSHARCTNTSFRETSIASLASCNKTSKLSSERTFVMVPRPFTLFLPRTITSFSMFKSNVFPLWWPPINPFPSTDGCWFANFPEPRDRRPDPSPSSFMNESRGMDCDILLRKASFLFASS